MRRGQGATGRPRAITPKSEVRFGPEFVENGTKAKVESCLIFGGRGGSDILLVLLWKMASLIGKLVVIAASAWIFPADQGKLGLVLSCTGKDDIKMETCKVRLVQHETDDSDQFLDLHPDNLILWAQQPVLVAPEDDGSIDNVMVVSSKYIENEATADELLRYMIWGRSILAPGMYAQASIGANLRLPIRVNGEKLMKGGVVEMLVQAIDSHIDERSMLWYLVGSISMSLIGGPLSMEEGPDYPHPLLSPMRDRAIEAGLVEKLVLMLQKYNTDDILSNALAIFYAVTIGGLFPESEARRNACASSIPTIVQTMKRKPENTAVQHYGMQALAAICGDGGAKIEDRVNLVFENGGHLAVIAAMKTHGHVVDESGVCSYEIKTGPGMYNATMEAPGSVLLAGCQFLYIVIAPRASSGFDGPDAKTLQSNYLIAA